MNDNRELKHCWWTRWEYSNGSDGEPSVWNIWPGKKDLSIRPGKNLHTKQIWVQCWAHRINNKNSLSEAVYIIGW